MRLLWTRLRARESGFGLVELLIAMTILVIGLLAVLATFSSGMTSLIRSSRVATASTIADSQMQLYRAITYCYIRLDDASVGTANTVAAYTGDSAWPGTPASTQVLDTGTCKGAPTPTCNLADATDARACAPTRVVTGPDQRSYRINVYMVSQNATGTTRPVKKITVVVRDEAGTGTILARHVSTFEQLLG